MELREMQDKCRALLGDLKNNSFDAVMAKLSETV